MADMSSGARGAHRVVLNSLWAGLFTFTALTQFGCSRADSLHEPSSLEVRSTSFSGGTIPKKYSCDGQDTSPEVSWNAPPERTQSFTQLVTDKDSLFGTFVQWVLYDLPSYEREIPEGFTKQGQPDGSRQGRNGFFVGGVEVFQDKIGYEGPCPPGRSAHRYVFALYALDTKLNLPSGASKKQVLKAMSGHVLATGDLVGRYQH